MKNGTCNLSLNKRLIFILFSIVLIILFISTIFAALTASIGNARMILRANVGETIQKTILVKNINSETINIEIGASGDLEKDIKILDSNFTLAPGEEKNARFTIKITKNGAFENKLNVKFFSTTEQKGVVLSSNIVVMVNGDSVDINDTDTDVNDTDTDNVVPSNNSKSNPLMLLLTVTGIVLLIFFILLIIYSVKNNKIEKNSVNIMNNEEESGDGLKTSEIKDAEKKTKFKKRSKRNE